MRCCRLTSWFIVGAHSGALGAIHAGVGNVAKVELSSKLADSWKTLGRSVETQEHHKERRAFLF